MESPKVLSICLSTIHFLPHNLSKKIFLPKYLIQNCLQIICFIVINTQENKTIIPQ